MSFLDTVLSGVKGMFGSEQPSIPPSDMTTPPGKKRKKAVLQSPIEGSPTSSYAIQTAEGATPAGPLSLTNSSGSQSMRGQQGVPFVDSPSYQKFKTPDIYEAYGIGDEGGLLHKIGNQAHDFLRTFAPGVIAGGQASVQALSEVEAQHERQRQAMDEEKRKVMANPQMVGAYEQARGMFPQNKAGFHEALQSAYGQQMAAKAAQDLYGGGLTGIEANPYVPQSIKDKVLSTEMALRSIPQYSVQYGQPTDIDKVLSLFTGRAPDTTPKVTGTFHGGLPEGVEIPGASPPPAPSRGKTSKPKSPKNMSDAELRAYLKNRGQ